ncbi:cell cycle control protein cwf15, putative [Plasmodium sp. DRC-Itaito]|nr:cell cycle control protein cwf15, putative [Plasmodium sp. DRC-Itaito]
MTTAHRPTWYNAIGGDNQGGNRKVSQTLKVCSRDLPGHLKMKTRDLSDYVEDRNMIKNNLIQLENKNIKENIKGNKLLAIENIKKLTNDDFKNPFPEDEDDIIGDEWKKKSHQKKKKKKNEKLKMKNKRNVKKRKVKHDMSEHDMSDNNSSDSKSSDNNSSDNNSSDNNSSDNKSSDNNSSDNNSSEDNESDEEEKELLRELENLKRERMEKLKKEKEEQELLKKKKNNVLTNNPLINLEDNSDNDEVNTKKRKWTDDAIFRNTCEKKEKKTPSYINDTVRSSFHKKFLFKYIH